MRIHVSPSAAPMLRDEENFREFALTSEIPRERAPEVADALSRSKAGELADDAHAYILVDWLVLYSGRIADAEWRKGLDAMLTYAGAKGWIREQDGAVRAHVEWPLGS